MQRILITGAAGEIGTVLRAGLAGRYTLLRLADIRPCSGVREGEEDRITDVTDLDAVVTAARDIDCIVHLAGVPREGAWDQILPKNIAGTYNVFEAARRNGVRRVVFASSNHVIGFHRSDRIVDERDELRPDSRYGVSANRRRLWRDASAERIGYRPEDDAESYAADLRGKNYPAGPATEFHGGPMCAQEFSGDGSRID